MTSHSVQSEATRSWYARFVDLLDPGEFLGELLFGLIMVLTFTLGAGIQLGQDENAARELLIAALGCNTAWGVIDAALFLIGRLSERGRVYRLVRSIQASPSREHALALIDRELDDRIPKLVRPEIRATLDQEVLDRLRETKVMPNRVTAEDLWAGFAVFWLVFLTALPAVIPFLVIGNPLIAMRASNAVLLGLLFYVGWRWAEYTGGSRWLTGLCMTLIGTLLVAIAIALGG